MTNRQKRYQKAVELKLAEDYFKVFNLCEIIHMMATGSTDSSLEVVRKHVELLKVVIDTWEPPRVYSDFDNHVLLLCQSALKEAEEHIRSWEEFENPINHMNNLELLEELLNLPKGEHFCHYDGYLTPKGKELYTSYYEELKKRLSRA